MAVIKEILNKLKEPFSNITTPAEALPSILLFCTAMRRCGTSAEKTTAEIIENNRKLGIPTGKNADGSENLINQHDYNLVKCIFKNITEDGVVHVSVPSGSLQFIGTGANGGGPITITGFNIGNVILKGIIR